MKARFTNPIALLTLGAFAQLAHASFVLETNYPTWLNYVNGPVIDPNITTHFNPANGSPQPVPADEFADIGLLLQCPAGLSATQYPGFPNSMYVHANAPGAAIEFTFTTPVSAAWVNSGLNAPQTGSDHGYLVQFFNGQTLLGQSTTFGSVGAISSEAFDRVVIGAPLPTDVVRFSAVRWVQIPGPGAFALLAVGALAPSRKRRGA